MGNELKAKFYEDKAQEIYPQDLKTLNKIFVFYYFNGKIEKALKVTDKIIELNPKYSNVYGNRGGLFAILKQYNKAIKDFNKMLEFNSADSLAYSNLAKVYYFKKDLNQSKYYMQKAVDFNLNYKNDNLYKLLFESKK